LNALKNPFRNEARSLHHRGERVQKIYYLFIWVIAGPSQCVTRTIDPGSER
jgi:hypothetical protein